MSKWQILLLKLLRVLINVIQIISDSTKFFVTNCRVIKVTFRRDLQQVLTFLKMFFYFELAKWRNDTVHGIFGRIARKYPDKHCFIFEDRAWTFKEVDEYSNKIAAYFSKAGFLPGDAVALFMENRPEFMCIWLGLAKIGVISAFINTGLTGKSLLYCVEIAKSKALIFGVELEACVQDIADGLKDVSLFSTGGESIITSAKDLDSRMKNVQPMTNYPKMRMDDTLVYMYTSGTTGMPKAANMTHMRYLMFSIGSGFVVGVKPGDIIYVTLPLYHGTGGMVGAGQAITSGATVVLRKKFSATSFWDDCRKHNCTMAVYIGEICRYLLAQPEKATDTQHKVRIICGNGVRPQIFTEFRKRFGIDRICESYGSTEGNAFMSNIEGTHPAVGYVSRIMSGLYPFALIRVDRDTGEAIRNKDGFCVRCDDDEPGELVAKIKKGHFIQDYTGYVSKSASEKKIIRDVFKKGDMAFSTGDIFVKDMYGYMTFIDRTGDTFRWKGENVSTTEVEAVISNLIGYRDCVVYGVQVPGAEGRAGMAAIVDESGDFDVRNLAADLVGSLPVYARPLFLRITSESHVTGNYKFKKVDLRKQGFDPHMCEGDRLYYLDLKNTHYLPLTDTKYEELTAHNNSVRL